MDFLDLRTAWSDVDVETDVCIIGSGPAGLTVAQELLPSGAAILVVESGGLETEDETEALSRIESVGVPRVMDQSRVRNRVFGGSSYSWWGRCAVFDDMDFAPRPWVPFSGWPIGRSALAPYLDRAAPHLGLARTRQDGRSGDPPGWIVGPGLDAALLNTVSWQFSQDWRHPRDFMRFGPRFRSVAAANLRVLLHATATDLVLDDYGTRVGSVKVGSLGGKRALIRPKFTVLCCGGIENARLMLGSDRQAPHGVGNAHDQVGRFLMDHPRPTIATFDVRAASRLHDLFGPYKLGRGTRRHVFADGLALSPELQRNERLLNCAAWLDEARAPKNPLDATKRIVAGPRSRIAEDAWAVLSQPATILQGAGDLARDRAVTHKLSHLRLLCSVEQRPDPQSRLTLAPDRDRLGLRIARIDWRIAEQEKASVAKLGNVIREEFARLGLPSVTLVPWLREGRYDEAEFPDVAHPAGTTRMGRAPRESVVDENCEVHGIDGLFVAGSSVFPTSGYANPTLMIVALAVRLADFLKARLGTEPHIGQGGSVMTEDRAPGSPITPASADAGPSDSPPTALRGIKVAVTGATGFIGGRLVEKLVEQGASVTCLVRSAAPSGRLAGLPVTTRALDLGDDEAVADGLEGAEIVFHCAYDWDSPSWNVDAIRALIAGCLMHRVRRLVHVSTFSVYQQAAEGELDEDTPVTDASSGYAANKLQLEREVLGGVREKGLAAAIVQPTIVYGPFSRPWTIDPADMLLNGTVVLPGQGEGFCNALFVDDLVDALILAATRPEAVGERFIVSGPEVVTWGRFYEAIAGAVGAPGPEYRPAEAIAHEDSSRLRKLRRPLADPALAVRLAARVPRIGRVLKSGVGLLPAALRERAQAQIFGPMTRRPGHVHLPNRGQLGFFQAKSPVNSKKIRNLLGYRPIFDFESGMQATAGYLADRYGRKTTRA